MSVRSPEISIDENNPFSKCALGRKRYAEILSEIVKTHDDGMVLALDNPWGTGKSTFVKMWRQYLSNQSIETIYFNAWENDFEQDALTSILAELSELEFFKKKNLTSFKKLVKRAGPLAPKLIPKLAKAIVRRLTDEEFASGLIEGVTEAASDGLAESIKEYAEKKKGLYDFKSDLTKLLSKLESKPLVFFIDELDRCRPDYAVHTLEVMKHFFDVKGIVFVLSIDKTQLKHAVRGVYGSEQMDASEYLRRFIDLEYSLPRPNNLDFVKFLYKHFSFSEYFESEFRSNHEELKNDGRNLIVLSNLMFIELDLSLREQEKTLANLKAAILCFRKNSYAFPELLLVLLVIRLKDKAFYQGIVSQKFEVKEIQEKLRAFFPKKVSEEFEDALLGMEARFLLTYHNSLNFKSNDFQFSVHIDGDEDSLQSLFSTKEPGRLGEFVRAYGNNFRGGNLKIHALTEKISLIADLQTNDDN